MSRQQEALAKACCADLYQSGLAQLILGDTLHPGGLALTNHLGKLMGIHEDDWVVGLASGQDATAMAVYRVFHCNVVGVEFGAQAVAQSQPKSLQFPPAPGASFLRGDAECAPFQPGSFQGVVCECSMSLFQDKDGAAARVARLLRPGGRFGISDVSVELGCLPPELDGTLGQLLCLTDALTLEGYSGLLEAAGLAIVAQEDASVEILKILDSVETKLGGLAAWQGLSGLAALGPEILGQASRLIVQMRELVASGKIGTGCWWPKSPAEMAGEGLCALASKDPPPPRGLDSRHRHSPAFAGHTFDRVHNRGMVASGWFPIVFLTRHLAASRACGNFCRHCLPPRPRGGLI